MTRRQAALAAVWLLVVVGLPCLGHVTRQRRAGRCAFDGLTITPIYRVKLVDQAGQTAEFCCLECALRWQATRGPAAQVWVTDEISGQQIASQDAVFVRSPVITTPATGNCVHAFASTADAQRHIRSSGGRILLGPGRPFAKQQGRTPSPQRKPASATSE